MNKEQALAKIENLIFEITSEYERGVAIGFINACLLTNIIGLTEHAQLFDRPLAE